MAADRPAFRYRDDVLAELWKYGVRPREHTPPELVRAFINDLYRHELRRLRGSLLNQDFPKHEYLDRVVAIRDRYPVLALRPRQWLVQPTEFTRDVQASRLGDNRRMRAVEITKPGPPEVLALTERPVPVPAAGELLIKVAAAGVNRPDVMQRMGHYPPPAGITDIPGLEVAGTVESVGGDVRNWKAGDRVCALVAGGGYAEYCVAPEPQCLPVPERVDLLPAAAIPETFFTVWTNLFERGRLQAGESVLIHGGSSGIGTTAIQLARARSARVFATAGSAEKCAACEHLGAERAINYREADFVAVIKEATGGRGVDVVLDMVGGDYLARNLEILATEGRLVQIAVLGGAKGTLNLITMMQRRLTLTGSTLRARPLADKAAIAAAVHAHVWPLLEAGTVRPVIHATFPLSAAASAHRVLESGAHIGKLVLVV